MRKQATSWVVKVLLGLLILSFAVWGIGDVFTGAPPSREVAEVDGLPIGVEELRLETDTAFRRLQSQLGQPLERSPDIMEGLARQALQSSVSRRLIDAQAATLGVLVDDDTLARRIREEPGFHTDGTFDRNRFEMFLRSAGMSEAGYVARSREDLRRQRLVQAVSGPVTAPESEARRLLAWRGEQRRGRALVVAAEAMEVAEPDEAALEAWLEEHAERYQAPEYRGVELAVLAAADLEQEITVDEAAVEAAYEARKDSYRTPEQRRAVQLLAADEDTIREAARRVAGGESFAEVADTMDGITTSPLGPVRAGQLPAALDETLFALGADEVGQPIETPFGWHLLRLVEMVPETIRPLAEVHDELARELREREALERLPQAATALDDAIAAGETVEEAAHRAGGRFFRLDAVDSAGNDAQGEPVEAVRLDQEMLREIFSAGADEVSLLLQTDDDRYYVFNVTDIEPVRPRRLDEVREEVAQAVRAERQQAAAEERAAGLLQRAREGAGLEELAQETPAASLRPIAPITRDAAGYDRLLSPAAVAALFATPAGEIAGELVEVPDGAAIVASDEVLPIDPDEGLAQTLEAMRAQMRSDILIAWQQGLRARFPVEVDQRAFNHLVQSVIQ